MNIDERLERLVERHEALSLNVELLEKQVETPGGGCARSLPPSLRQTLTFGAWRSTWRT